MAGEDDEQITIVIDDALDFGVSSTDPADKRIGTKTDGEGETVTKAKDPDPIESLKGQLATAQTRLDQTAQRATAAEQRAADAETRAQRATTEAEQIKTEGIDAQIAAVDSGIQSAIQAADAAEAEYAVKFAEGDGPGAAKAQRKMAAAEAERIRLIEAKADLDRAAKAAPRKTEDTTRRQPEQQQQVTDPVERYIQGRTAPTAAWLREHTDYITDPRKNNLLTSAHYKTVADGIQVDTPAYFAAIEKEIGLKDGGQQQQQQRQRRPSAPVAQVQNSGGGVNGGGNEVKLSKREADAAQDGTHVWNYDDPSGQKRFKKGDPIGVQEFARRKLAMQKSGQYDRTYIDQ